MTIEYPESVIADLLEGRLPWAETHQIMSAYKDSERFRKYVSILNALIGGEGATVLPIGERLVIVLDGDELVVRCHCGHVFGDYRRNWKLGAQIRVRDTEESLEEIYPGRSKCDPEWMEIRELICPGCAALLEVEAVPPGYPLIFDFLPDLDGFYEAFLGQPLPESS
jgi:acetone carboxylase, gamma subunit